MQHRQVIADAEGWFNEVCKHHQSELALNALASTIVESGFQQGLVSTRENLEATSRQLQDITAESSRLSQRNLRLAVQVADLQRLAEPQVEIQTPAPTPEPHPLPSVTLGRQTGDSHAPSRPTAARLLNSGRNLFAALSSAGIQIKGASERNAREKPSSSRNWKEVRSLLFLFSLLCLHLSFGQYDASVEPPARKSKYGFPNY